MRELVDGLFVGPRVADEEKDAQRQRILTCWVGKMPDGRRRIRYIIEYNTTHKLKFRYVQVQVRRIMDGIIEQVKLRSTGAIGHKR
jgi:hypothetical protein